ncbi:MAG: SurA N-terminal domain-containing protein [Betaproteobacteria bacterium]|nr:SurA N-terminal domain-containing protein [Betaproteobacteria bacterium]
MFEAIRNNKRIAQVILALIIIPFAAFGLGSYFGDGPGAREIAKVGDTSISRIEFDRALEEARSRLRERLGEDATAAMLDSEELRQSVLDQLITRRALELYFREMRLTVSTEQLQQAIFGIEGFQENGQFSQELYQRWLHTKGLAPVAFEAQIAQDMLAQQLVISIGDSLIVAHGSARRLLAAELEERVVREMRFPVAPHLAGIEIDDAAIRKFYDDNPARFELPERIKAEYIVLSEESLLSGIESAIEIDEADIQQAYDDVLAGRHVRHILIESASGADAAAQEAARKQAEEIVEILRKEPDRFPELAREKSQDPGSSEMGGDLGVMMRDGTMEPSFEKAAFALKQDEISDPVRTGYGFHVIQVTAIQKRSLDEMRNEIVDQLRKQVLGRELDEKTRKFSEMVFSEAPDSLQSAAEAFGLEIQRSDWIDRGASALGEFRNESLVASLFEDDALNQRHNTHPVDVGANTLVSARVIEHEARRRLPLEEVREQIEAQLRREEAMRLAREKGNAALAALDSGEAIENAWSMPRSLRRSMQDLPTATARAVFGALEQLPARTAAELTDDAYVIYQIDSVERPSIEDDDPRIAELAKQYGFMLARSDFEFFLATLRDRYKIVAKSVASQEAE